MAYFPAVRFILCDHPCNHHVHSGSTATVGVQLQQFQEPNVFSYGTVILDVGQKTVVSSQDAALATILILLGLMQVFFGFRLIRITLVITGFISWVMILMATFQWESVYYFFTPSKYYFWMWLLAGLVGAILCFRFWNLGVTFSGAFGGFAVSMGIIAVSHPHMSTVGQYILLAFLVLFGAAIATFYERYSIIVGTSCGGAFMFMYGVDEIVQVGYREMIVIFEFEGKTLMYHTNPKVIVMIGCSLALALLGIAWEFWHHEKPLWLNQRALFRIYGRPFGKRPEKLAGNGLVQLPDGLLVSQEKDRGRGLVRGL
ncbi:hypothetical protein B0O80DRAFT_424089 [Mortierella sp. GBAus27b]|nr:hypothetical protein B0O80DRAFT_424089 [Mortierella sp. GBAus27b]